MRVEYVERVDELFVNSPRSRFVADLRNYMLHYELPATAGSWSWSQGEDTVHAVGLQCEPLKRWDGWKALARQFIDDSGETIALHETLSGYVGDVNRFQKWFAEAVTDANRAVLAEAQKIEDRANVLADELRPMFGYDE